VRFLCSSHALIACFARPKQIEVKKKKKKKKKTIAIKVISMIFLAYGSYVKPW
jgi:hypothetical protein